MRDSSKFQGVGGKINPELIPKIKYILKEKGVHPNDASKILALLGAHEKSRRDAFHPANLQAEIISIEKYLNKNPKPKTTFLTLSQRVHEWIKKNRSNHGVGWKALYYFTHPLWGAPVTETGLLFGIVTVLKKYLIFVFFTDLAIDSYIDNKKKQEENEN